MPATTPRGVPYALSTDPIGNYPTAVSKPQAEWIDTNLGALVAANSLRLDTTVGTRVFGTINGVDYMLYGDTGWRNILPDANAAYFSTGSGSNLLIRRTQSEVELFAVLRVTADISADVSILNTGALPQGFALFKTMNTVREVFRRGNSQLRFNVTRENSVRVSPGSDSATITTGDTLRFTLIWPGSTDDTPWPTTLPGTPA